MSMDRLRERHARFARMRMRRREKRVAEEWQRVSWRDCGHGVSVDESEDARGGMGGVRIWKRFGLFADVSRELGRCRWRNIGKVCRVAMRL